MKLHLKSRFYHFLWKMLPKKVMTVAGIKITYVIVPKCLLLRRTRKSGFWCDTGYCLTHQPSKSIMIFVSDEARDKELRYTLLHEYAESIHLLDFPHGDTTIWRQKFQTAFDFLDEQTRSLLTRSVQAGRQTKAHLFALVIELAFMKQELPPEKFQKHLDDVSKCRI